MNPIIELSEFVQKRFGQSITTKVVAKEGLPHIPTITVAIHLPNGETFTASGANKRLAKQEAAQKALLFTTQNKTV